MAPIERSPSVDRTALVAAALVFSFHLVANPHYGFFRDELYFIICGRHPQFGYVDQPPVVPLLSALTQIFGSSLVVLRAIPALFAAGGAFVTVRLVREFGGGRFASVLGALVYALTPVLSAFGAKVGTDEVGLVAWPLLTLVIVRIARGGDARGWTVAGLTVGVAFESKYSVLFYVAALIAGMLLTRERRLLWNWWFLAGCGIATAIALPNAVWQAREGWPMLELLHNGAVEKNVNVAPPVFLLQELLITNPALAFVWVLGLVWLLRSRAFRFVGFAYVALIVEMVVLHGKHYYPASVYPILIAAGAVQLEAWSARGRAASIGRPILVAYAICLGALFVPDVVPVLPEAAFLRFSTARDAVLHIPRGSTETEHGRDRSALPGDFADMHGWPAMASAVRATYDALPERDRREAVVFAGNYGEASAVQFFEPGLPVIGSQNQDWLWGPGAATGRIVIQVNGTCFQALHAFGSRTRVRTLSDPYAIGFEQNIPIWICRDPKRSLTALWPEIKNYE